MELPRRMTLFPPRTRRKNKHLYIKSGRSHDIQREVDAIFFVRRHTAIPVPTVVESHIQGSRGWFTMHAIEGEPLSTAWDSMGEDAKTTAQNEIRDYIRQLRALQAPNPGYIGSCMGGEVLDHRLNNGMPCGPFGSVSEFNDFLVAPILRCPKPELATLYRQKLSNDYKITFSHADLSDENILVEPASGHVTGIIDWEMAGWRPAFWEYTKSLFGDRLSLRWKCVMDHVLEPYPTELQVEDILQQF
ncbi:hypothetical protein EJ05DRAFT_478520 [Pseudovirgaria hyperparasitica]|uniref:Aminoglycoside phosphotransferase domain-containing protein n=1 Tax=Pseudovirgaria hyperparasitica TaxID=470096 RepID=A0A6A6W0S4_9PEZI|nr:uncharacterized protein EJ05DRAFT_478520 [Pseudovirgaria hyperparasitica]KAF2755530.1 hypothetical protein EJ05DRAFT_478520 [Pseudovirgaria hyperparasitica]